MHTKKKKSAPLSLKNSESEIVLIIYFKDLEIVDSGVLNLKQMAKYLNLILVVQFKIREKNLKSMIVIKCLSGKQI